MVGVHPYGRAGVSREHRSCGRGHLERPRDLDRCIPACRPGATEAEIHAPRPETARQATVRYQLPLDSFQHIRVASGAEAKPRHTIRSETREGAGPVHDPSQAASALASTLEILASAIPDARRPYGDARLAARFSGVGRAREREGGDSAEDGSAHSEYRVAARQEETAHGSRALRCRPCTSTDAEGFVRTGAPGSFGEPHQVPQRGVDRSRERAGCAGDDGNERPERLGPDDVAAVLDGRTHPANDDSPG